MRSSGALCEHPSRDTFRPSRPFLLLGSGLSGLGLRPDLLHQAPADDRRPLRPAVVHVSQPDVVEPQEVQDGRVDVVDV